MNRSYRNSNSNGSIGGSTANQSCQPDKYSGATQYQQRQYQRNDGRHELTYNRDSYRCDSSRNRYSGQSNNSYINSNNNMDGHGEQLRFSIKQTAVGLVIGRGGSNIKELQQKFHVKVDIDQNGADGNSTVTIKGATQDVQDAKREVLDLVRSQRSYESHCSSYRSDDRNRGGYDSQRNQSNPFGRTTHLAPTQ